MNLVSTVLEFLFGNATESEVIINLKGFQEQTFTTSFMLQTKGCLFHSCSLGLGGESGSLNLVITLYSHSFAFTEETKWYGYSICNVTYRKDVS